jgi:hypothetical protein
MLNVALPQYMDNRPDIAEGVRTVSKSGTKAYKHSKAHVAQQHPDWDMMRTAKVCLKISDSDIDNE